MKKPILLTSILASSALCVTAFGQVINGSFSNGLAGWTVQGSNTIVPTRASATPTVPGLGNASVINGNAALLNTGPGAPLTVTSLLQTFTVPGQAAVRSKFGHDVGSLSLSNYGGKGRSIRLGFQFQFLTNESQNAVYDFFRATLNNKGLASATPLDPLTPGANGFTRAGKLTQVTTDISALQGKAATLAFTVADTIDAVADSGVTIQNVVLLPSVLQDNDAIASVYKSGLPMALGQRDILLNTVQSANRDVNERLFRLRADIAEAGNAGPTGHHGKDAKDSKKTIVPPEEPRWEVFATGNYGNRDVEAAGATAGFTTDLYSGTIGAEYKATPHLTLGLAATFVEADNDLGRNVGDVHVEGYTFSGYASYAEKNFYADVLYNFGTFHNGIQRQTGLGHTATAQPDSSSNSAQFNTGYNLYLGGLVTGPIAGLDYVNGHIHSYKEAGGGLAGISVGDQYFDSLASHVGWQVSYPVRTGFGRITPQLRAEWVHEYLNPQKTIDVKLRNSPYYLVNGGNISRLGGFQARGATAQYGDDYLSAGAGVSFEITDRAAVILDYETRVFQDDSTAHNASVTGSWKF